MQLYGSANIPIDALRSRLGMLEDNIESLKSKGRAMSAGAIAFYLEMADIYNLLGHFEEALDAAENAEHIAEKCLDRESLDYIEVKDRVIFQKKEFSFEDECLLEGFDRILSGIKGLDVSSRIRHNRRVLAFCYAKNSKTEDAISLLVKNQEEYIQNSDHEGYLSEYMMVAGYLLSDFDSASDVLMPLSEEIGYQIDEVFSMPTLFTIQVKMAINSTYLMLDNLALSDAMTERILADTDEIKDTLSNLNLAEIYNGISDFYMRVEDIDAFLKCSEMAYDLIDDFPKELEIQIASNYATALATTDNSLGALNTLLPLIDKYEIAEDDPEYGTLAMILGRIYMDMGNFKAALKELRIARHLMTNDLTDAESAAELDSVIDMLEKL